MKQKKFIALVAIVMVLVLCVSIFAACNKKKNNVTPGPAPVEPEYVPEYEIDDPLYFETTDWFTTNDLKNYSYRMGPSSLPTSWNYHTYQSNASTYILDYCGDSLYTFDYKDNNYDAFKIVPSMAYTMPEDITDELRANAEAAAKWGITDETKAGKAYRIELKHNLKFDNGDAIDAHTFVESMRLLLNPDAANFRADNVYKSGNLKIQGAESYAKSGRTVYDDPTGGEGVGTGDYVGFDQNAENYGLSEEIREQLVFFADDTVFVGNYMYGYYSGAYDVDFLFANYAAGQLPGWTRTTLIPIVDEMSGLSLQEILDSDVTYPYQYTDDKDTEDTSDDEVVDAELRYQDILDALFAWWCTDPEEEFGFFAVQTVYPVFSFDEVGFYAEDDYHLVIVLKNEMEYNFYLKYELCTSFFLVHPTLYTSRITTSQGAYANDYGTSVDTFIGYGPYKLTQYVADSTIVLERNLNWHGYSKAEYREGTYQTNHVVYHQVTEDATRLEMFLKGELDSYGLQEQDMEDYGSSSNIVYTDSESTWYLALNPDEANLTTVQAAASPVTAGNAVIKTVLCIDDFRKALSYSLDRNAFNLALSPTSGVAKALLSAMIVADPEQGISYRSTTEAKDAILSFWGLSDEWGDDKEYEDRDDAIDSITGYDPAGAKALFTAAYNQALEKGYITEAQVASGKWEVQIVIGDPTGGNFYQKGYEFLKTNWINAVVGTPFEGHLAFVKSQVLGSTTFGNFLREGKVDLLFGVGYGGSAFDPYSMMDCFTGSLQYDPFTDKTKVYLDITYDFGQGVKTYRASIYAWVSEALQGDEITITEVAANGELTENTLKISAGASDPANRRIAILAAAEEKIMTLANIFPIQTDSSASLRCERINYKTKDYILGMGFGGIAYYTYTLDDEAFLAWAESQPNGIIDYKS